MRSHPESSRRRSSCLFDQRRVGGGEKLVHFGGRMWTWGGYALWGSGWLRKGFGDSLQNVHESSRGGNLSQNQNRNYPCRVPVYLLPEEANMAQKVIEIVGSSKESFAKVAENAVAEAAKTVRGMKWARVAEFEMLIEGKKIAEYPVTARIYFDIER
jgi:flavin-binding protein dodecin